MGNKIRDCGLLIELLGANLWTVLKLSSLVSHIITSLAQRSKVDLCLISKCVVSLSSKLVDHASTFTVAKVLFKNAITAFYFRP